VLWQQFKRVSVTWPDDGEVAAIERGDPDRALPFGEGDHGCVRPAQPQVRVSADQVLDALPVGDPEIGHFQLAVDDGRVQAGFRFGAELPVDQVGGLRMTMAVVTRGPSSPSSSARQTAWSLSARSAVATSGPVSTIST
jgi:hypothetical protein